MSPAVRHLALMARNTACANEILFAALARLQPGEWTAPRTGFFPSLSATLHHIHAIDLYYLDALTGGGLGLRALDQAPVSAPPNELALAQSLLDRRLIAFCDGLDEAGLTRPVMTDRGADGPVEERVDLILLHLFQHQIHHRGQAHAMLSGSSVAPPQLDDFFLRFGRVPQAAAWWPEAGP